MTQVLKDVFGTADNVVFALMLLVSASIGIWYAIVDRKKTCTQEYLMGGRSLSVLPVAMSSWHGFLSAVTLLGVPSEVYRYGTQYLTTFLIFFLVMPVTAHLYLPVFYNLRITSAYEYLGIRFHPYIRTIGSGVFFIHMMMYMPIVLYAPALALSEVTGIKIWTAIFSTGLVCTFYTCIGGVKAVVWTDCLQSIIIYGVVLMVVIKGALDLGGFGVVWQRSLDSKRIEFFNFEVDPTIRHTSMTLLIGGYFMWMGNYAASQSMVQRYLTVKSLRDAQLCVWLNLPAVILLNILVGFAGLVMYAYYWQCDPIGTKIIQAPDQLFPRFVMETFGKFQGLPGLFVAGVYSGAISTMATGTNSLAATVLEDFIKISVGKNMSERTATRIGKILCLSFGLMTVALTFVVHNLISILQAAVVVHGIVGGPMLGVFTLGMFFPFVNAWGAGIGLLSGFATAMWFGIGQLFNPVYISENPVSYDGCMDLYFNATGTNVTSYSHFTHQHDENNEDISYIFRLSYLFLSVIGFCSVLVVGLLVSFITGCQRGKPMDERLITPLAVWFYKHIFKTKFVESTENDKPNEVSLESMKKENLFENGGDLPKESMHLRKIE